MHDLSLKTLRKVLTREEFIDRAFRKSNSIGSKTVAKSAIINFEDFCRSEYGQEPETLMNQLRENPGDSQYIFLQDFIDFLGNHGKKAQTVRAYFSFIRSYLRSQGIRIYSEDVKDLVRLPTEVKEMPEPLTKEKIKILLDHSKPTRKALYLSLCSSGMRISEALSLRKKDFDFSTNPVTIRIPGIHTKTKQTRETYISGEAKESVLRIVEKRGENDLVFGKSEKHKKALDNECKVFDTLRKRCGLVERYSDGKRHKITIHSMRAFFHTEASLVHDEQYANALDGHQGYLMQYYRLSPEKRAELYLQLEPSLLVYSKDNTESVKLQEQLNNKEKEIENLTNLIIDVKMELEKVRKRQERMEKTIKIG